MISQRHGTAALGMAVVLTFLLGAPTHARAQVATHTNLASSVTSRGATLTATVSDAAGSPATAGVVSFIKQDGGSLGSAFVRDGKASLTTDQRVTGRIYADYSGSAGFRASNTETDVAAFDSGSVPDFSITAAPSSASVSPGQFATYVLTITPLNGFDTLIALSCSNNPLATNCYFTPASAVPSGQPVTSTLQITTAAASGNGATNALLRPGGRSRVAFALGLPGLLALAGFGGFSRRHRIGDAGRMLLIAALATILAFSLSACSQRFGYFDHPPINAPGVVPGDYTVTVTAYSSNGNNAAVTSHTVNVTLTVK